MQDSYYDIECRLDFANSFFDIEEFAEELDEEDLEFLQEITGEDEPSIILGSQLAEFIIEQNFDISEESDTVYMIAKIATDGSIQEALRSIFVHVNERFINEVSLSDIDTKSKEIVEKLDVDIRKDLLPFFVSAICARCTGFYYTRNQKIDYINEDLLEKSETIASWRMTESIYQFAIIKEKK